MNCSHYFCIVERYNYENNNSLRIQRGYYTIHPSNENNKETDFNIKNDNRKRLFIQDQLTYQNILEAVSLCICKLRCIKPPGKKVIVSFNPPDYFHSTGHFADIFFINIILTLNFHLEQLQSLSLSGGRLHYNLHILSAMENDRLAVLAAVLDKLLAILCRRRFDARRRQNDSVLTGEQYVD